MRRWILAAGALGASLGLVRFILALFGPADLGWGTQALVALVLVATWVLLLSFVARLALGLDQGQGPLAALASAQLWWAAWAWPCLQWIHLPPPHNIPERPLQIGLAGLCLGSLAAALAALLWQVKRRASWSRYSEKGFALRLAGLAWMLYLAAGIWGWRWHMTGDTPVYLLMGRNLALQGDLDLGPAYRSGAWRSFYDLDRTLTPQEPPLADGRTYAEHKALLPLLLAPAYRAGGFAGALWMHTLMAALATGLFYLVLRRTGAPPDWSFLGWSLFALGGPWWVFSQAFYVEVLAGCLGLLWMAAWTEVLPLAWACLIPALLPWVGSRFLPSAGLMVLAMLWRQRSQPARALLAPLLLALSLGLSAWMSSGQLGSADPMAAYHRKAMGLDVLFKVGQIPRFLFGMLIDQEYGLFTWAPILVLAGAGAGAWWARRSPLGAAAAMWGLPYVALMSMFAWWHGDMAPNRYLICMVPVLALAAVEGWRCLGERPWILALACLAWLQALVLLVIPWFCYSKQQGEAWPLRLLEPLVHARLTPLFPSFIMGNLAAWFWAAGLGAALLWLFAKAARQGQAKL